MTSPKLFEKHALITGGSRGIGRAVALRFAAEGASLILNHLDDDAGACETLSLLRKISADNGFIATHRVLEADMASESAINAMFDQISQLDILVNNAGMQLKTPGHDFATPAFNQVLAVDLIGPAFCARRALQLFLQQGGGSIINTTSAQEIIPKPEFLAYSIAKGGLGSLTRTLALEYADKNIRVNAVGPGAVITDMNASWANDPTARAQVESHIPMGRAATVEDIAGIYLFLASKDAAYITGQTIFACGGLTLYADFKQNWAS